MILEAWMIIDQATLNALWPQAHSDNPPENLKLITNGVRGLWNDIPPDEVLNVIGTEQELSDLEALLGADLKSIDAWYQGDGFDYNLNPNWITDPDRILSLMPSGTFENPIWVHVFLGQAPDKKIFAGQYSTEFTTEFL